VLGWVNVMMGLLLPAVNYLLVYYMDIQVLREKGFSEDVTAPFVVTNWTHFCLGFLLFVSGIGLIQEPLWGRVLSIAWVGLAFLGVLVSAVCANVALELARQEWEKTHAFGYTYIEVWWFAPFSPAYAVVLLSLMFAPRTRRWVRGVRAERRGVPPEQAWDFAHEPPTSSLAVTSMVLSMVPFLLLTQMTAFVLGIIALRRIRRSRGKLGGKGYAWTGVIISSLILTCFGSLIGLAVGFAIVDEQNAPARQEEMRRTNYRVDYDESKVAQPNQDRTTDR
jgi:hypothetical protein